MKKLIYFFLVIFLIVTNSSCTKESGVITKPVAQESTANNQLATTHYIGERFGGGIIFFLDNAGKHGLIAKAADFEEPSVWSFKDTINGAGAAGIGKGSNNTNKIYKAQGAPLYEAFDYAALECMQLQENGYQDWFLPSKDELNEIYKQKDIIGGFNQFSYWSSTEADASKAWLQNFGNGSQFTQIKTASYALRPIRKF